MPEYFSKKASVDELEEWTERVRDFAHGVRQQNLAAQVGDSNLGQTFFYDTDQPTFAAPIFTLVDVRLKKPVAMDVSFSYVSVRPDNPPVGSGFSPALEVGNGFCRLTWGAGSGVQVAEIDGSMGWRHAVVASQLRLEYVPIDPQQGGSSVIPGNQPRKLGVTGMVAPAFGIAGTPLQRTSFFNTVVGNSDAGSRQIPPFAYQGRFCGNIINADFAGVDINLRNGPSSATVASRSIGGTVGTPRLPDYAFYDAFPVPQGAQIAQIQGPAGASVLVTPSIVWDLRL